MAEFASGTNPQRIETPTQHHLMLKKGDHCWRFNWMDGDKNQLVATLLDLAVDTRNEFDWFDAAIVRHQLDGYV